MKMKSYAVDILSKKSHGRYGKTIYASGCLSDTSKENASIFGLEIVAGMKWRELLKEREDWREILKDTYKDELHIPEGASLDDEIGYDNAEAYFSARAEIMTDVE